MMLGLRMQQDAERETKQLGWPGFIEAGLGVALVLTLVEQATLGTFAFGVLWVGLTLFAALGVAVGTILEGVEAVVARFSLSGWPAAAVRAGPTALVGMLVARTSFEGAFASTLPGAASAHVWSPVLGYLLVVLALRATEAWAGTLRRRRILGVGLAITAVLVGLANRNVKTSELVDLHTALVLGVLVAALLAVHQLTRAPSSRSRRTWSRRAGVVAATVLGFVSSAGWGLRDADDRWTLTTRGTDTRLLVRAARGLLDADGDGFASALGGGDCDEQDAGRNPGVPELPGNDFDENCDGVAARIDASWGTQEAAMRADLDSWGQTEAPSRLLARTRDLDLVLLSVDALRADMLAPTQRNRHEFPNLFALAEQSVRFDLAFAPAAGTDLSLSTMLTGRIDPFSGAETTLAEGIAATGRRSHGVIPSEVLRYAGKALLTRGLARFDRLVNDRFEQDVGSYSTSHRASELALGFVDETPDASLYLWIHYFDVHEHDEIKARDRQLRAIVGDTTLATREDRYRATVRLVDAAIGELLDGLRERGRYERTIVALVSDHGESLGEDPRLPENHGLYLYNPLIHVPLMLRVPQLAPASVPTAVSILDLAPTLAQLVGADLGSVDGTSLLPMLMASAPKELREVARPIVLNESDQYGLIHWPYKVMQRPGENLTELYDLSRDFAERDNLAIAEPERVQRLLATYYAQPRVQLDRTRKGRRLRERTAQATDSDGH